MLGFTVLFAVLATIASASPLPMPAVMERANNLPTRSEPVGKQLAERQHNAPWKFSHYYADNTPCWVDGRRGWIRDQTCGELVSVNAKVAIGKRGLLGLGGNGLLGLGGKPHTDNYFADGLPCFRNGQEGILHETVCAVLDVELGGQNDASYPWHFNKYYTDKTPCWVDQQRGWVHDGYCSDLIGKRFYRDDPYLLDGVPCWIKGQEGVMKDYVCAALGIAVKRHYRDAYYNGHGWYPEPILVDDTPCYKNGRAGVVKNALCLVADVQLGKRLFSDGKYRHGPIEGDRCLHDGKWGVFQNALCVLVDVQVKRDLLGGLVDTITGQDHGDHFDRFGHYHKFAQTDEDAVEADITAVAPRRMYAKRALLGLGGDHGPHSNGKYHDEVADVDAAVAVAGDGHRAHRYRKDLGTLFGGGQGGLGGLDGVTKMLGNGGQGAGEIKNLVGGLGLKNRDLLGLGQGHDEHKSGHKGMTGDIIAEAAAAVQLDGDHKGHLLNHVVRQEGSEDSSEEAVDEDDGENY